MTTPSKKNSVTNPAQASRRRALIGMAALAAGAISPLPALAQSDKPIRFILPVATGSGVDTITRATSIAITKALGHPVVIDNQPGAGGIVGTAAMVKAAPDGFTLSVVSNNHVIYPGVYKSLPFDPINDITPITVMGTTPLVLVVNPAKKFGHQFERTGRAAEGQTGWLQLCVQWQRHHPASGGRNVHG